MFRLTTFPNKIQTACLWVIEEWQIYSVSSVVRSLCVISVLPTHSKDLEVPVVWRESQRSCQAGMEVGSLYWQKLACRSEREGFWVKGNSSQTDRILG